MNVNSNKLRDGQKNRKSSLKKIRNARIEKYRHDILGLPEEDCIIGQGQRQTQGEYVRCEAQPFTPTSRTQTTTTTWSDFKLCCKRLWMNAKPSLIETTIKMSHLEKVLTLLINAFVLIYLTCRVLVLTIPLALAVLNSLLTLNYLVKIHLDSLQKVIQHVSTHQPISGSSNSSSHSSSHSDEQNEQNTQNEQSEQNDPHIEQNAVHRQTNASSASFPLSTSPASVSSSTSTMISRTRSRLMLTTPDEMQVSAFPHFSRG